MQQIANETGETVVFSMLNSAGTAAVDTDHAEPQGADDTGQRTVETVDISEDSARAGTAFTSARKHRKNMGQAKQRGTAEQRAQAAREKRREGLQPIDVDDLRAEHGVPAEAEFVGFVVWLRERDEFLVRLEETPTMIKRSYGQAVEAAVQFPTWDDAVTHADASNHPAVVAAAFDLGKQMFIIGG